ncbi:uncharacterized protein At3g28850-like [Andrographis paniculata]|uniref:uncharacterized protein At3g28850-like n=1 Tax=Andrographis paniculata TaxID=175694 RepID=UPI0021E8A68E|nr:uncharacterized protein At3g28850-like [Andrographis paniculata]
MGCASSKPASREFKIPRPDENGDCSSTDSHVVHLTSTTYGALELGSHEIQKPELEVTTTPEGFPEIIDARELMQGIESELKLESESESELPGAIHFGKHPKSRVSSRKKIGGKENRGIAAIQIRSPSSEKGLRVRPALKEVSNTFPENTVKKPCPWPSVETKRRKCPCPPDAVVLYTTTLRGIRKTFDECNVVRSILEWQGVRTIERDISMDSGFREELRGLMEDEARVPAVFVKGRLIGGAEEMLRLEEEGRLGSLLDGVPKAAAAAACGGCGGARFVVCGQCYGSCRVWSNGKCAKCNENGLIVCPLCTFLCT